MQQNGCSQGGDALCELSQRVVVLGQQFGGLAKHLGAEQLELGPPANEWRHRPRSLDVADDHDREWPTGIHGVGGGDRPVRVLRRSRPRFGSKASPTGNQAGDRALLPQDLDLLR